MSDLPPGWQWSTIGEVADVQLGRQRSPKNHSGPHMRPYLRSANVTWSGIDLADVKEMNFEPAEADIFELAPGDLLLNEASGSPNEVGKPAIWQGKPSGCCFQNTLLRVRTRGPSTAYLYWFCRAAALLGQFGEAGRGVNIRHLGKQGLAAFPIPVPPHSEQGQIVAAIEEHLSRLNAAEAALRSALRRLSTMRSSLIQKVTCGDWDLRPLGDVLVSLRNGCFVSRPKAEPCGLPILRISAVRPLHLNAGDVRYAPRSLPRAAHYQVAAGDVLFTRYSGNPDYVGACAVVTPEGAGLLHPDKLIRGVPDSSVVAGTWIALAMSAATGRREIEQRLKTTAGQVGIAGSQLRTVPIPVPPLAEQSARIASWERGLQAMARLRTELETSIRRADVARRSILGAALSGKLVPQDPADEPASVLLAGIRAEQDTLPKARRVREAAT